MARPSLEGLRLALLDGQDVSVRRSDESNDFVPFNTPEHFIESIEIRDARYMGAGQNVCQLVSQPLLQCFDRWSWDRKINRRACPALGLSP